MGAGVVVCIGTRLYDQGVTTNFFFSLTSFFTAPSSPPQYLRVARKTSTSFTLTWQPPPLSQQNGAIQFYTLTVQELGTNATQLDFTTNDTNITISSLHPYYYYESNVRAENILPGPFSEVILTQLDEDGKSCELNIDHELTKNCDCQGNVALFTQYWEGLGGGARGGASIT